jgi:hypothetical protein
LLDNTHAMIGIDDLIADVEVQITVHKKAPGQERGRGENVIFTINILSRNGTKSKVRGRERPLGYARFRMGQSLLPGLSDSR